jgi:hypothetical protein
VEEDDQPSRVVLVPVWEEVRLVGIDDRLNEIDREIERLGTAIQAHVLDDVPAQLDALRRELVDVSLRSTVLSAAVTGVLFLVAVILLT